MMGGDAVAGSFSSGKGLKGPDLTKEALGNKPASQGLGPQLLAMDHRSADQARMGLISPLLGD